MDFEDLAIFFSAMGLWAGYTAFHTLRQRRKYTDALDTISRKKVPEVQDLPLIFKSKPQTGKFSSKTLVFRATVDSVDKLYTESPPTKRLLIFQRKSFDYFGGDSVRDQQFASATTYCGQLHLKDVRGGDQKISLMAEIRPKLLKFLERGKSEVKLDQQNIPGSVFGKVVNSIVTFLSGMFHTKLHGYRVGVVEEQSFLEAGVPFYFLADILSDNETKDLTLVSAHCLARTLEQLRTKLSRLSGECLSRAYLFHGVSVLLVLLAISAFRRRTKTFKFGFGSSRTVKVPIMKIKCPNCNNELRELISLNCSHLTFCTSCFDGFAPGQASCPDCEKQIGKTTRIFFT